MKIPHESNRAPEDDSFEQHSGGPRQENFLPIPEGLTTQEEVLIRFLRENGFKENPDYLEWVKQQESELDAIKNAREGQRARIFFDIKKALIIGMAGDTETAYEMLRDVGIMAQQTNDREVEDAVDATLTLLGL